MKSLQYLFLILLPILCFSQTEDQLDLHGTWGFRIDKEDVGLEESWYKLDLDGIIKLPGSMNSNGLGDDISVETQWIGEILDSSWYNAPKYAKYRKDGNVKIPFWLQPDKHYIGAAWYQKEITIPEKWTNKPLQVFLERPHWESKVWIDDHLLGTENRLGTPHRHSITEGVSTGKHKITIRIDNRIKEVNPGISSHSISDQTQTNWNGIIGEIKIESLPEISIEKVRIFPDVKNSRIQCNIDLKKPSSKRKRSKAIDLCC